MVMAQDNFLIRNGIDISLYGYLSCKDLNGSTTYANKRFLELFKTEDEVMGVEDKSLPDGPASLWREFSAQDEYVARYKKPLKFINIIKYPQKSVILHGIKAPIFNKLEPNQVSGIMIHAYELDYDLLPVMLKNIKNEESINNLKTITSPELSSRELECLSLIRFELSSNKIAETLGITKWTVESYIKRIKEKLKCNSKKQLIKLASNLRLPIKLPQSLLENINTSIWDAETY